MKILYLSYNGILEPLGQSQVLSYIKNICLDKNYSYSIISFEKKKYLKQPEQFNSVKKIMSDQGIDWHYLEYIPKNRTIRSLKDLIKIFILFNKINKRQKISQKDHLFGKMNWSILVKNKLKGIKNFLDL